jgi:hypothetical protein
LKRSWLDYRLLRLKVRVIRGVAPMSEDKKTAERDRIIDAIGRGYTRPIQTTGALFSALAKCMDKHPSLRLGQLIVVALSKKGHSESALFNLYDEDMVEALEAFANE